MATAEQDEVIQIFSEMLRSATADGARKIARGEKVSWKVDPSHEPAIFSHLNKWKHGELVDADSGAHPLVHMAWRCLAKAWQEDHRQEQMELLGNSVDRSGFPSISREDDSVTRALDEMANRARARNRFVD